MSNTTSNTKTIIKGSFWIYVATFFYLIVGFLTTIILSRILDRENWGIFSTVLSVSLFLSSFVDLGFSYTISYYTTVLSTKNQYDRLRAYLYKLFKYRFILILFTAMFIFVFSENLSEFFQIKDGAKYFQISSLFFIFLNLFTTFDCVLNGLKRFKTNAGFSLFNYLLRLGFAFVLIYVGFETTGALLGYAAAYMVSSILALYLLKELMFPKINSKNMEVKESAKDLFVFGAMLGLSHIATIITVWTDSIMIGAMIGTAFVGVYRIAISMSSTLGGAIGAVNRVIFPILVGIEAKKEESSTDLNNLFKYGSFFTIPAVFGIAILSTEIISILFGNQYIDAAPALFILSYLCLDTFMSGAIISYFSSKKEVKLVGISAGCCAVLNVGMNYLLIPPLGIIGAAIASVITRIINFGVLVFEGNRRLELNFSLNNFKKPLLGSVMMILVIILLKQFIIIDGVIPLLFVVFLGGLVYIIFEAIIGFNILVFGKRALTLLLEK